MKKWIHNHYPLILILIVGFLLRFNFILKRGTLWFDEIFSVHFSLLPWGESFKYWLLETNPFLYNLFLRGWIHLFGQNEIIIRILSLIFGLLTILVVYKMAEKLFSQKIAVLSSIMICLSGIHIFVSGEARTYPLLTLLTTLSFFFFIKIFIYQEKNNLNYWIYYLIQILLLYTHLTALTVIFIQAGAFLYLNTTKKLSKKKFVLVNGLALFLWCFWFIPTLLSKLNFGSLNGWFFTYDPKLANLFTIFNTLFINAENNHFILTLFSIILFVILFHLFKILPQQTKEKQNLLIILVLWAIIPPILGSFLGQFITKYFIFSLPALTIITSFSLASIRSKTIKQAIIIIFFMLFIPSTITMSSTHIFSWYDISKYIEKNETDNSAILVIPFNEELAIKKYYTGISPVWGIYPIEDNLKLEERIVRYNWQTVISSEQEYENWMKNHTQDKDKIFFLQYGNYQSENIIWFINKGWKFKKNIYARGEVGINLYEFWAPNYNPTTSTINQIKD